MPCDVHIVERSTTIAVWTLLVLAVKRYGVYWYLIFIQRSKCFQGELDACVRLAISQQVNSFHILVCQRRL